MMESKTMSEFSVDCRICGESHTVMADEKDVCHWQEGSLIQDAMPYLSADDRELLISGTCPDCWVEMFGISDEGIDF